MNLSVILPVHNEEANLQELYKRLSKSLKSITTSYEIVFVDDGSSDSTEKKIKQIITKDKKVKLLVFSRNFGHMAAVSAGLHHTRGKKVVVMDADLQDPPEVIPELYKKSKQFDIVYAVKNNRKESVLKRFLFRAFYRVIDKLTVLTMPANAGTFSLLDRKVVDLINKLPERNKYFSGLRVWTGYTQTKVDYERGARDRGSSKSIWQLFQLAFDGITSFSYLPLKLSSLLGFIIATFSFLMIIAVLIMRFYFDFGIVGWASTISVVLLIGGIQLITLGIIGEYLGRIYDEVKQRPEYVITKSYGVRANSSRA